MDFLAILVSLALLQLWGSGAPLQQDTWFHAWRNRLASRLDGAALQLCVVFVPAAAIHLLYRSADGLAYGLAELTLCVVAILYASGRGDLSAMVTEYLQRWSRGDFQAAYEQLQTATASLPEAETPVVDPAGLHVRVKRYLYYRGFERLFAVLFWFALAGPGGAVAYRLTMLDQVAPSVPPQFHARLPLADWLNWLPERLLGAVFALIGNFDACLGVWRTLLLDGRVAVGELLQRCGDAALGLADSAPAEESREDLVRRGTREIVAIEVMQRRSLVLWVVVIAILTMRF